MTETVDILVVEDDAILREALTEWLQAAGYGVRTAADGEGALASVSMAPPALVVTDIHMPRTDGSTVIAELQRHHPDIPIVAISGLFESRHGMSADDVIALGAARTLAKPFQRRELLGIIAELLSDGR
jgi:CheY-like chemotaxis protein